MRHQQMYRLMDFNTFYNMYIWSKQIEMKRNSNKNGLSKARPNENRIQKENTF